MRRPHTLVLGVGNTILTDDGVGVHAAREVERIGHPEHIEVREAEVAGFDLIDLMAGFERVVVLDAIKTTGRPPGSLVVFDEASFEPTSHLCSGHQIDLPTALAYGKIVDPTFPASVVIIGIQIEEDSVYGEALTPAVGEAVRPAAELALRIARSAHERPVPST